MSKLAPRDRRKTRCLIVAPDADGVMQFRWHSQGQEEKRPIFRSRRGAEEGRGIKPADAAP